MKKRKPIRKLTADEAEDILLTVTSGERNVSSWAKELGCTVMTVSNVVHGRTFRDVLPDVPRIKESLAPQFSQANERRWAPWRAELDEVRALARAAAPLRVQVGALASEDVDAWVEEQVEEHRAARRAEKKRAANVARYGTESERRRRRRAANLERARNLSKQK